MSVARGKGQNGGHYYSNITQPVELDCNFTVDSTNGNGLGVRSIKSNGYIQNVFMHTTATPGMGLGGQLNPNPAAGYILVQFKNNFNYYLGGYNGLIPPLASTGLTSTTIGSPVVITSLGTTSLAQWQAAGLPKGLTPTVGQSFVPIATGALGGTGTVGAPGVPLINQICVVGDPNGSIANSSIAANGGAYVLLQCLGDLAVAAPANNSVIALTFKFDCSSVSIPDGGPSNSSTSGGL
jgi:hypothetical protein